MNANTMPSHLENVIRYYLKALATIDAYRPESQAWINANLERDMWIEIWEDSRRTTGTLENAARRFEERQSGAAA